MPGRVLTYEEAIRVAAVAYVDAKIRIETERLLADVETERAS